MNSQAEPATTDSRTPPALNRTSQQSTGRAPRWQRNNTPARSSGQLPFAIARCPPHNAHRAKKTFCLHVDLDGGPGRPTGWGCPPSTAGSGGRACASCAPDAEMEAFRAAVADKLGVPRAVPRVRLGRFPSPERPVAAPGRAAGDAGELRQPSRLGYPPAEVVLRQLDEPRAGFARRSSKSPFGAAGISSAGAGTGFGATTVTCAGVGWRCILGRMAGPPPTRQSPVRSRGRTGGKSSRRLPPGWRVRNCTSLWTSTGCAVRTP